MGRSGQKPQPGDGWDLRPAHTHTREHMVPHMHKGHPQEAPRKQAPGRGKQQEAHRPLPAGFPRYTLRVHLQPPSSRPAHQTCQHEPRHGPGEVRHHAPFVSMAQACPCGARAGASTLKQGYQAAQSGIENMGTGYDGLCVLATQNSTPTERDRQQKKTTELWH